MVVVVMDFVGFDILIDDDEREELKLDEKVEIDFVPVGLLVVVLLCFVLDVSEFTV